MRTGIRALFVAALVVAGGGCKPKGPVAFEELTYPVETKTVQVGSTSVAYTERGSGERTLVLIHGLGSYLPVWSKNLDALAGSHRVVALDLPGYGKSSKRDFEYSMDSFAEVVHGVVQALDLKRVTLVGHSMGGQVSLTYALRYPGQVEALVLTSPAGLETFSEAEAKLLADSVTPEFTCEATPEEIQVRHAANFHAPPADAEFMMNDRVAVVGGADFEQYCVAVDRSVSAMLDGPVYDRLPEVEVPVLVLFGKQDALIPNPYMHPGSTEEMAKKAVQRMPQAQLTMLDQAGHMAHFELSQRWNEAVLEFLASGPRSQQDSNPPEPSP